MFGARLGFWYDLGSLNNLQIGENGAQFHEFVTFWNRHLIKRMNAKLEEHPVQIIRATGAKSIDR